MLFTMNDNLGAANYRDKESLCESVFNANGPYWHMYTNGALQTILFTGPDDMKVAMNLFAVSVQKTDAKVYTFEIMNNHIHVIFSGAKEKGLELFGYFKLKLGRYFCRQKRVVDLTEFNPDFVQIETLQSLRNEIVYANRNGYLVHPAYTPFTYPWGANSCYFNPQMKCCDSTPYKDLKVAQKRIICRSNEVNLGNENLRVYDGVILPSTYCHISEGESFFRDAHHYFHLLSRNYEAYSEIASRIHEQIVLTDEEMYAAVTMLCRKDYNVKQPALLPGKEKVELARRMHDDYNASNRQIRSILKISQEYVDEMFPKRR